MRLHATSLGRVLERSPRVELGLPGWSVAAEATGGGKSPSPGNGGRVGVCLVVAALARSDRVRELAQTVGPEGIDSQRQVRASKVARRLAHPERTSCSRSPRRKSKVGAFSFAGDTGTLPPCSNPRKAVASQLMSRHPISTTREFPRRGDRRGWRAKALRAGFRRLGRS